MNKSVFYERAYCCRLDAVEESEHGLGEEGHGNLPVESIMTIIRARI